ncbi:cytochrome P450 [Gymnopilus junonius]|uniref:Cytochrome P450 n=1 Tax=Gymnopilus junonius TaxID=109634 RepID=A0A9P5TFW9_GYMJU|nr:cytochrome P450 [Gymnopilus junonius]
MIQEGYNKYYGSAFKIPTMSKWLVIVSGREMVDDVRRASDQYMSLDATLVEILRTDYTMGPSVFADPYHIGFLRTPLTKHLANHFADAKNEIARTVHELFQMKNNGRVNLPAHEIAMKVIARASHRMFVGLPLCRNSEYLQLSEKFTIDVFVYSQILNMFPEALHPMVGWAITSRVSKTVKRAKDRIHPLVEACIEQKKDYDSGKAESTNNSSNLISWLVNEAQESGRSFDITDLTRRILVINFVSIGSTAAVLSDALFNLAAHPQYAAPIREEVEAIVEAEGWTRASIAKMRKLDSFVRETQRTGTGGATGNRKIMKDFTFSNGISLPSGTCISFATRPIHHDANHYDSPTEFQGFRFFDTVTEEGDDPKNQVVSLGPDYLTFGTGRHAW